MSSLPSWTLYVLSSILICVVVGLGVLGLIKWLIPRFERMEMGVKAGPAPCCPPGLGCNDPNPDFRHCVRREARRLGNVEEIIALDQTWTSYQGAKKSNPKRVKLAQAYGQTRDNIIARVMREAEERIGKPQRLELPAHLGSQEEIVDGEPMDGPLGKKIRKFY